MLDVVAADKYVKSSRTILHQSSDTSQLMYEFQPQGEGKSLRVNQILLHTTNAW